jgi:transcription initiation factor TFIID TATA-box-binding protein
MPKARISGTVVNIVVTATVNSKLDLEKIVSSVPGTVAPENFPAVIYRPPPEIPAKPAGKRDRETNPCILVFSSGKMVCPGTRDIEKAKALVRRFINDLKKHGIEVDANPTYKLSNVVASGSLGGFINLESAAVKLRGIIFEPEQFPGLIYRMEDPHATFLLFTSGNFVCPGAPDEKTVYIAAVKMRNVLESEGLIAYADP